MKDNKQDALTFNDDQFGTYLLRGINLIDNPEMDSEKIKSVPMIDQGKLPDSWLTRNEGTNSFAYEVYVEDSEYELVNSVEAGLEAGGKIQGIGLNISLKAKHTREITQNTKFGNIRSTCKIMQYGMGLSGSVLKDNFSQAFIDDLTSKSAEYIFETYGTHLVTKFSIGGKLNVHFVTKSTTTKTTNEIKAEAKASYAAFSGGVSGGVSNGVKDFVSDCDYSITGQGGNLSAIPVKMDDSDGYSKWADSVWDHPAIYEIEELIPIWDLVEETNYSNLLKNAYYNWYYKHLVEQAKNLTFISKIRIESRNDSNIDKVKSDDEFVTKYGKEYGGENADCNKGVGGDYIYILYELDKGKIDRIVDIKLNSLGEPTDYPCLPGYIHLPQDLNKGAKGRYIYIDYMQEKTNKKSGYQALGIRTTTIPENKNWKIITDIHNNPVDMNQGSGGDYLYLFGYIDPIWEVLEKQTENVKSVIESLREED